MPALSLRHLEDALKAAKTLDTLTQLCSSCTSVACREEQGLDPDTDVPPLSLRHVENALRGWQPLTAERPLTDAPWTGPSAAASGSSSAAMTPSAWQATLAQLAYVLSYAQQQQPAPRNGSGHSAAARPPNGQAAAAGRAGSGSDSSGAYEEAQESSASRAQRAAEANGN